LQHCTCDDENHGKQQANSAGLFLPGFYRLTKSFFVWGNNGTQKRFKK